MHINTTMYDVAICVRIICKQLMSRNMLQTLHPCQSCSSAHLLFCLSTVGLRDHCFLDITTVVKHCRSCPDACWKIYCHSAFHDGHTSWWNYWSLCGRPWGCHSEQSPYGSASGCLSSPCPSSVPSALISRGTTCIPTGVTCQQLPEMAHICPNSLSLDGFVPQPMQYSTIGFVALCLSVFLRF